MKIVNFLFLFLFFGFLPGLVLAQTCVCYDTGGDCQEVIAVDEEDCDEACQSEMSDDYENFTYIEDDADAESELSISCWEQHDDWSADLSATVEDNPLCWSKDACEKDYTGDGVVDGEWNNTDGQAKQQCGSGDSGFCYPVSEGFELNVALPNGNSFTKSVTDLGDYVNKMYLFMLAAAATFAVVRIMAAGVQYIIAPSGGEVSNAQKKISSSLIGLIILSAAALLLATINPQLLSLKPLSLPKIRTLVYFGNDVKCETYLGYGFEEDLSGSEEKTCGKKGKVVKGLNGENLTAAIDCIWTGCQGEDYGLSHAPAFRVEKTCLPMVGGGGECLTCEEVNSQSTKITPGSGTCSALQPTFHNDEDKSKVSSGDYHAECVFNHDAGFEYSDALEIYNIGQCAVVAFDCAQVKAQGCSGYDSIVAWNNLGAQDLDAFQAPGVLFDYSYHKSICEKNPCGVAGGCQQDRSEKLEALITGIKAFSAVTILNPTSAITLGGISAWTALTGDEPNGLSCESAIDDSAVEGVEGTNYRMEK